MKTIVGIKCQNKFYVAEQSSGVYAHFDEMIVNGKIPKKTFHSGWFLIDEEPKTIQRYVRQPDINHRYELIDKTMKSSKLPLVFNREDVAEYVDGYWEWNDDYCTYKSLYRLVVDKQPDILEDVEFEYETLMEVSQVKPGKGFAYDVQRTRWKKDGTKKLTEKDIQHQLIDKIVFPDILLPERPCSLTPKQSFDIIRQYVKQHINYEVATITSDYDFCFTVKKKIPLSEPEEYTVDVNNSILQKRKRKPKYETRYKKSREIECFNMAPKPYQNYSIIQGFRADNQEDLKDRIDNYCEGLIMSINEPVKDCPQCKGRGVIL